MPLFRGGGCQTWIIYSNDKDKHSSQHQFRSFHSSTHDVCCGICFSKSVLLRVIYFCNDLTLWALPRSSNLTQGRIDLGVIACCSQGTWNPLGIERTQIYPKWGDTSSDVLQLLNALEIGFKKSGKSLLEICLEYPINCASCGRQGSPWVYGYAWCFQYLSMFMEHSLRVKSQSVVGQRVSGCVHCKNGHKVKRFNNPQDSAVAKVACCRTKSFRPIARTWIVLGACLAI